MAIFLLVVLYCILEISAGGSDTGLCIFFLFMLLIGAIGMVVIYINDSKRKKDGERCMRNWEEYKRKM